MPVRYPLVAGMFYPAAEAACIEQVQRHLKHAQLPSGLGEVCAGIVPHAGWVYSGDTAAYLFAAFARQAPPDTVWFFGAVHSWSVTEASVYGRGAWRTPMGEIAVDEQLATALVSASDGLVVDRPAAHAEEHSIEVQLPFLRRIFPHARIVPIAVPPSAHAVKVGRLAAQVALATGKRTLAVGSSDLTHYGSRYGLAPVGAGEAALRWTHENDARIIRLVEALRAEDLSQEAAQHHNACGPGAIAATIGYAKALGADTGTLLHYTTSYEVEPSGRPTDLVGYCSLAFS